VKGTWHYEFARGKVNEHASVVSEEWPYPWLCILTFSDGSVLKLVNRA